MHALSLKGILCVCVCVSLSLSSLFSLSHSRTGPNTWALLKRTTKACLSSCGPIRSRYKETNKANVSIPCSGGNLCLGNQEKHRIRFVWGAVFEISVHRALLYDVDMCLNKDYRPAFYLIKQAVGKYKLVVLFRYPICFCSEISCLAHPE